MIAAVLALWACASPPPAPPGPRVVAEPAPDGIRLAEGGRPILFYRSRPEPGREPWRVHYVHPLHSAGGAVLTEDAPADHLHHRGVFWAWRRVLVDGVQAGDGWVGRDLVLEVGPPAVSEQPDGSARIDSRVLWKVPIDGRAEAIVEEHSAIRAFPVRDGRRRIEFEVRLRALRAGVAIAGTDDEKGYGGPSVRFGHGERISLRGDGRELRATPAALDAGEVVDFLWPSLAPPWPARVRASCSIEGRAWTHWVLRQEASMQNCAFPGRNPLELQTDSVHTVRLVLDVG
jgi:hypothetical protein